jgi:hypothetical protein
LAQSGYLVPNPQDEHFGCYGGSDRVRDSIGGKSTRAVPTGEEIAAAANIVYQSHTENPQPAADGLFKEYQAWAAEEDARTQVRPVQKQVRPVQNARVSATSAVV